MSHLLLKLKYWMLTWHYERRWSRILAAHAEEFPRHEEYPRKTDFGW